MAKTDYRSVDEYLASQPESTRPILESVRAAIRKALPKASEVISYQIPAYRTDAGLVIFFAGWKNHYSIYPASDAVLEALGDKLADYKISRGTIRFPLDERVPVALISRIAKIRAKEMEGRVKEKAKKGK